MRVYAKEGGTRVVRESKKRGEAEGKGHAATAWSWVLFAGENKSIS